jgi:hydroxyacylglutathione hydrolase
LGKFGDFIMIVEVVEAPYFGTNCWIFAAGKNSECFIVDPGIGANPTMVDRIRVPIERFKLKPIAVLLTHGHLDHTFSVYPLATKYEIPALIHPLDRRLIREPLRALTPGGESEKLIAAFGITEFMEPEVVQEVEDGQKISLAGFEVTILHSPGHTKGSVMFNVDSGHLISGDVLFAGAIGRTDLPTGSQPAMIESLRKKVLPLSDELIVLPGHGPQTTIARERKFNPYLQESYLNGKRL